MTYHVRQGQRSLTRLLFILVQHCVIIPPGLRLVELLLCPIFLVIGVDIGVDCVNKLFVSFFDAVGDLG